MRPHYNDWDYKGSDSVARVATALFRARKSPSRLSPLIQMTEPERTPDVVKVAQTLPLASTLIYRHFGKPDRLAEAQTLRDLTLAHRIQYLIGNDPELAVRVGADGVHFRRDPNLTAAMIWRRRCPDWLITMAGVKDETPYTGDLSVLDGMIVSSVFPSSSPTAGKPIGTVKLTRMCARIPAPVFALGGINADTAPELIGSGAAGLAGVSGLLER